MQIVSPAALVAVIVAAKRTGDKDLERSARIELERHFGVKLSFAKDLIKAEAAHADAK